MYIGLILSIILRQKNQHYAEIIVQRSNQFAILCCVKDRRCESLGVTTP